MALAEIQTRKGREPMEYSEDISMACGEACGGGEGGGGAFQNQSLVVWKYKWYYRPKVIP